MGLREEGRCHLTAGELTLVVIILAECRATRRGVEGPGGEPRSEGCGADAGAEEPRGMECENGHCELCGRRERQWYCDFELVVELSENFKRYRMVGRDIGSIRPRGRRREP